MVSGNLSFIDAPSGGLKFLNRQTVSSSTAFVAFDNTYINTTYDDYIIKGSRIVPVSDGVNMRWFTSSQNGGNMTPGWYSNGMVQRMDTSTVSYTGYYGNVTYFEIGLSNGTAAGESIMDYVLIIQIILHKVVQLQLLLLHNIQATISIIMEFFMRIKTKVQ